jgi:hypothetical protein
VGVAAAAFAAAIPGLRGALNAPGASEMLKSTLASPAGPLTVFFWAPMSKWAISWSNLKDLEKPLEKVSISQMSALTLTGVIWTLYSFVIAPVNYNVRAALLTLPCSSPSPPDVWLSFFAG